jgi:hypothetical protein
MPRDINYSDGSTVKQAVVVIWEDNHTEARGNWYRAFWANGPDGTTGSPVIGFCSAGGSHRRIWQVKAEVQRFYPHEPCYRNGRLVK